MHLFKENICILFRSSLKFILGGPTDNYAELVQVMNWPQTWYTIAWTNEDTVRCLRYSSSLNELKIRVNSAVIINVPISASAFVTSVERSTYVLTCTYDHGLDYGMD